MVNQSSLDACKLERACSPIEVVFRLSKMEMLCVPFYNAYN